MVEVHADPPLKLISSERIELESCACARIKAFDDGNWWLYPDELEIRGREGEARQT